LLQLGEENNLKNMKKILNLTFMLLTTIFVNSQSLEKLDSVSAHNLYVSTNKKQVLTRYETTPEQTYILFYGDGNVGNLEGYDFITFNTKSDLIIFLDLVQRSIIKSNIIIHRVEKGKIKIQGVTGQTAEINLNKYKLYLNQYTIKEIKNQLD
jgi:hypothetical protein